MTVRAPTHLKSFPRLGGHTTSQAVRNRGHNTTGATMDRCDKCGAQAYVTTTLDTGLPLTWCAHDYQVRQDALTAYTTHLVDMRHQLHT